MDANLLKVADQDELPPGKGKTIVIRGQELTIYNREGRYVACSARARGDMSPVGTQTDCTMPGHHFDVGGAASSDRLLIDDQKIPVVVYAGIVYVVLDGAS